MNPENRYYLRTQGNLTQEAPPTSQQSQLPDTPSSTSTAPTSSSSSMSTSGSEGSSSSSNNNSSSTTSSSRSSNSRSSSSSTGTRTTPSFPGPVMASAPRHHLEAFSGINQDPRRWLSWYDRYCAYYRLLRDEDKMSDFPFHLTEHARAWYDSMIVPETFIQLREMFEARFQQTNSMDFMSIKQAPSESVQDYYLRLCKCRPNGLNEEWVKGIAIRGLRDDVRTIVMPQNPASLEAARRASLLAEETLSMSAAAPVAAVQQSTFETVVLEQLAQLKLELDNLKSKQGDSDPHPRDERQRYQSSGKGYKNRKQRYHQNRQPEQYQPRQEYQQSQNYHPPGQQNNQQTNHYRQQNNRRGGYKGSGGKQFSSFQSNTQ